MNSYENLNIPEIAYHSLAQDFAGQEATHGQIRQRMFEFTGIMYSWSDIANCMLPDLLDMDLVKGYKAQIMAF